MFFTQDTNAGQFNLFSYGLGKENIYGKSEESSFGNSFKDGSSVSHWDFSFSGLSGDSFQPAARGHDKRSLSDTKTCQTVCKRSKQMDNNTSIYTSEGDPLSGAVDISASALADELVEARQSDNMPAARTCTYSSGISCPDQVQSTVLESLHLPDWVTSFPGYFEDYGLVAGYNRVDHIVSPVHKYLPRKDVPIGPEHQADIPECRPRVSEIVPVASGSCGDIAYSSVSAREFVRREDDSESDKWVMHCVVPMSTSPFDRIGDDKVDCECSDEGLVRCVRQHILEARESLKMSLGPDRFQNLGLCEMGEDVAQRWTDEEEKRFQREVFASPVSLGKNFWDYLPHAFPGKSTKELVSYYFNVFMLRKRAQQNRSDLLHVDSDDDELPDEPPITEYREEYSAVEDPSREHFINNPMSMEDVPEESGEHISGFSLHANAIVSAGD